MAGPTTGLAERAGLPYAFSETQDASERGPRRRSFGGIAMGTDVTGRTSASAVAPRSQGAVVGVDIGGTSIKMGLVSQDGEVLATSSLRTGALDGEAAFAEVLDTVTSLAREGGLEPEALAGVGVDVPGVVLPDGKLDMAPNVTLDLSGLLGYLRTSLPGTPLATLNDCNAAALGETWVGAGRGADSLVMVALGTGVGAGVVVDGKVTAGAHGAAGEIGHLCVEPNETRLCNCGCRGCLEQYASARGLIRLYREACARDGATEVPIAHATDALAVFEAARAENPQAREACEQIGVYLARALSAVAVTVDPGAFVVGGGMCGGWDTFGDACLCTYRELAISSCKATPIRVAALGNKAGFLGAARAVLTQA